MIVLRDTGVTLTVILHKDDIELIKTKKLLGVNPIIFESKIESAANRTSKVIDLKTYSIRKWHMERDDFKNRIVVKLFW